MRRQQDLKTNAIKRVIRKDNLIGFHINFEDSEEKGGAIMPKEQFDYLVSKGKTLIEIVSLATPQDKKIKEVYQMSEKELDKMLDISADKLIKQEFENDK